MGKPATSQTVIGQVRFSYLHVFSPKPTPSGDMKYSVSVMIPKSDAKLMAKIQDSIQVAIQEGLEKGTITQKHIKGLRLPVRDGDAEFEMGKRTEEYKDFMFFNATTTNKPGVLNQFKEEADSDEVYSGCWGFVDVGFFAYNVNGNIGIGCGLNNVMKKKDGERLDGRRSADSAFKDIEVDEDDEDGTVF